MKKLLAFSIMLGFASFVFGQTTTIYINSQTVTCNVKGMKKECLQYKMKETDTSWTLYTANIQGFTYNPGYFYTLQVQKVGKIEPPVWKLINVVSKTKSTTQQEPADSTTALSKPPAALIGQWNFSRLSAEVGDAVFTKEFLRFDPSAMRVTGKASCNGFFGNYTADSTKGEKAIHFEALGHTMMACENLATENKLLKAMELVDNWQVNGNMLYLKSGDKVVIELTKVTQGTI